MAVSIKAGWERQGLEGPILHIMTDVCEALCAALPAAQSPEAWTNLVCTTQRELDGEPDLDGLSVLVAICGLGFDLREVDDWTAAWEVASLYGSYFACSDDKGASWRPIRMRDFQSADLPAQPALHHVMRCMFDDSDYDEGELVFMQRTERDFETYYAVSITSETDGVISRAKFGPWDYVSERPDKTSVRVVPSEALKAAQAVMNGEW